LRDQFDPKDLASLYVAPGTERSLALYSEKAFEALASRFAEKSPNRSEVRNYLRLFYARADKIDIDSQGRIRIPDRLLDFAGLKEEVVLLGVHDHAEVWDHALWQEFLSRHESEFDRMASDAFE
jgi:MraZ protein